MARDHKKNFPVQKVKTATKMKSRTNSTLEAVARSARSDLLNRKLKLLPKDVANS